MNEIKVLTGREKLKAAVENDISEYGDAKRYLEKHKWILERAEHYAGKTGLSSEELLTAWEEKRNYWYMNYYQEANQPEIKGDEVKVFETIEEMLKSIGDKKFRCPSCNGVTSDPYTCKSGVVKEGRECDWKVYGFLGDLGKGASVFVKEKLSGETIFMPIAWEI